ncbi:hypothetical protein CHELA17_64301 [Chelatococcus asaccharovorans]|nr:hypothetical protein CHELA17_64301 [Chelatococcus asaccharovorans]
MIELELRADDLGTRDVGVAVAVKPGHDQDIVNREVAEARRAGQLVGAAELERLRQRLAVGERTNGLESIGAPERQLLHIRVAADHLEHHLQTNKLVDDRFQADAVAIDETATELAVHIADIENDEVAAVVAEVGDHVVRHLRTADGGLADVVEDGDVVTGAKSDEILARGTGYNIVISRTRIDEIRTFTSVDEVISAAGGDVVAARAGVDPVTVSMTLKSTRTEAVDVVEVVVEYVATDRAEADAPFLVTGVTVRACKVHTGRIILEVDMDGISSEVGVVLRPDRLIGECEPVAAIAGRSIQLGMGWRNAAYYFLVRRHYFWIKSHGRILSRQKGQARPQAKASAAAAAIQCS